MIFLVIYGFIILFISRYAQSAISLISKGYRGPVFLRKGTPRYCEALMSEGWNPTEKGVIQQEI